MIMFGSFSGMDDVVNISIPYLLLPECLAGRVRPLRLAPGDPRDCPVPDFSLAFTLRFLAVLFPAARGVRFVQSYSIRMRSPTDTESMFGQLRQNRSQLTPPIFALSHSRFVAHSGHVGESKPRRRLVAGITNEAILGFMFRPDLFVRRREMHSLVSFPPQIIVFIILLRIVKSFSKNAPWKMGLLGLAEIIVWNVVKVNG